LLPNASQDYLVISRTILPRLLTAQGFPLWHAHTLRAFILLIFPGQVTLSYIFWILISILAVIAFIRFWQDNRRNQSIIYAGAICLTVLVTPHAMIYDWVILLIPAVLLWDNNPEFQKPLKGIIALLWVVTIISGSLTYFQFKWTSHAVQISVPIYIFILVTMYYLIGRGIHDISD
jgi:membrane-bound ClpP family serine protease